jgi:hypothetical protein
LLNNIHDCAIIILATELNYADWNEKKNYNFINFLNQNTTWIVTSSVRSLQLSKPMGDKVAVSFLSFEVQQETKQINFV